MPGQACGIIGLQQMKDCSLEHPAAGRAAARRPDASYALRNGIAGGPKRRPPANAIPVLGSESPQTPFDLGTAGDEVRCAQQKKSFMPNSVRKFCPAAVPQILLLKFLCAYFIVP